MQLDIRKEVWKTDNLTTGAGHRHCASEVINNEASDGVV